MRRTLLVVTATLASLGAGLLGAGCGAGRPPAGSGPAPAAHTAAADTAGARREAAARERQRLYDDAVRSIVGRDSLPATEVFDNIKVFTNARAIQVLRTMNGWSNALGVSCEHCHVTSEWASETKPTKQAARDMVAMVGTINRDLLPKIPNLRSESPRVGCNTCHQGNPRPGMGAR